MNCSAFNLPLFLLIINIYINLKRGHLKVHTALLGLPDLQTCLERKLRFLKEDLSVSL